MPDDPEPASKESEARMKEPLDGRLKPNPDDQIAALRERVSFFKKQVRLLLERFERREISQTEARVEAERLGREVGEAERQVEQWEAEHRRRSQRWNRSPFNL
jgi:hypothetical protein